MPKDRPRGAGDDGTERTWSAPGAGAVLAALHAARLASVTISPAVARSGDDFAVEQRVVVNTDAPNVRHGPGLDEQVIHVVVNGMQETVNDDQVVQADHYDWYRIELPDGTTGWVAGAFLVQA